MTRQDPLEVFNVALEHTFYVSPTDLGLTVEELFEAGRRVGLREGELQDAIGPLRQHAIFVNGRFRPKGDITTSVGQFFLPMNPEYRPFPELDFICEMFYEHKRDVGQARARLSRPVVVERGVLKGFKKTSLESAIAILVAGGYLKSNGNDELAWEMIGSFVPSEQVESWRHGPMPEDSLRRDLLPIVSDIVGRRTDGRLQSSDPLKAFPELLESLGYGPFRLWWTQTVSELGRSDESQNSVAVCVLAAALVEGALTFVVKHGRTVHPGLFASGDFDRPPWKWKIEDLVKSATFSGGDSHIFDEPLKARIDGLIATRQRIHAGRMLEEYPNGVPDLRPDDARDAKRTAEVAVRRIIDWVQAHPVELSRARG